MVRGPCFKWHRESRPLKYYAGGMPAVRALPGKNCPIHDLRCEPESKLPSVEVLNTPFLIGILILWAPELPVWETCD
jgi:hypothetical protein